MNLVINVDQIEQKSIVEVSGEIDVYTADRLKEKLLPLTEEKGNLVQVDLQNISYMDSTGLGVFISAYKSTKAHGSTLELINARDRVLRLFIITGLHEIINLRLEDKGGNESEGF